MLIVNYKSVIMYLLQYRRLYTRVDPPRVLFVREVRTSPIPRTIALPDKTTTTIGSGLPILGTSRQIVGPVTRLIITPSSPISHSGPARTGSPATSPTSFRDWDRKTWLQLSRTTSRRKTKMARPRKSLSTTGSALFPTACTKRGTRPPRRRSLIR